MVSAHNWLDVVYNTMPFAPIILLTMWMIGLFWIMYDQADNGTHLIRGVIGGGFMVFVGTWVPVFFYFVK